MHKVTVHNCMSVGWWVEHGRAMVVHMVAGLWAMMLHKDAVHSCMSVRWW